MIYDNAGQLSWDETGNPERTRCLAAAGRVLEMIPLAEARRVVAGWDDGTLDDRNAARQAVSLLRDWVETFPE